MSDTWKTEALTDQSLTMLLFSCCVLWNLFPWMMHRWSWVGVSLDQQGDSTFWYFFRLSYLPCQCWNRKKVLILWCIKHVPAVLACWDKHSILIQRPCPAAVALCTCAPADSVLRTGQGCVDILSKVCLWQLQGQVVPSWSVGGFVSSYLWACQGPAIWIKGSLTRKHSVSVS